jgi:hypothetical protein
MQQSSRSPTLLTRLGFVGWTRQGLLSHNRLDEPRNLDDDVDDSESEFYTLIKPEPATRCCEHASYEDFVNTYRTYDPNTEVLVVQWVAQEQWDYFTTPRPQTTAA